MGGKIKSVVKRGEQEGHRALTRTAFLTRTHQLHSWQPGPAGRSAASQSEEFRARCKGQRSLKAVKEPGLRTCAHHPSS